MDSSAIVVFVVVGVSWFNSYAGGGEERPGRGGGSSSGRTLTKVLHAAQGAWGVPVGHWQQSKAKYERGKQQISPALNEAHIVVDLAFSPPPRNETRSRRLTNAIVSVRHSLVRSCHMPPNRAVSCHVHVSGTSTRIQSAAWSWTRRITAARSTRSSGSPSRRTSCPMTRPLP